MICAVSVWLCLFCVYLLLLCFSVWFAGRVVSGFDAGFGYFVLVLVLVLFLCLSWSCWFGYLLLLGVGMIVLLAVAGLLVVLVVCHIVIILGLCLLCCFVIWYCC